MLFNCKRISESDRYLRLTTHHGSRPEYSLMGPNMVVSPNIFDPSPNGRMRRCLGGKTLPTAPPPSPSAPALSLHPRFPAAFSPHRPQPSFRTHLAWRRRRELLPPPHHRRRPPPPPEEPIKASSPRSRRSSGSNTSSSATRSPRPPLPPPPRAPQTPSPIGTLTFLSQGPRPPISRRGRMPPPKAGRVRRGRSRRRSPNRSPTSALDSPLER